jgi:two-component system chemotaxis response regulator CheY
MLYNISPLHTKRMTIDKTILVVDDLPQMRDMTRTMLRNNRFDNVIVAGSGNQALRQVGTSQMSLVLADWHMPNMDGMELLTQIKNNPKLFSIPVIIMSEERTESKILYAVEEGADGFLIKPFNENDLINNIKRVLIKGAVKDERENKVIEMRQLKLSKNYHEALELGIQILDQGPNQRVTLMICDCLYQIKEYDKAISMISDTGEANTSSEYSNLLGKIYMTLGQHSQGIFALEQATKVNPLNSNRKIELAEAYVAAGRRGDAENIIQRIINDNPTDLSLVQIAQIYLDLHETDKAGRLLRQTVAPIKSTINIFNNYAVALRQAEMFEEAMDIYLKCLKIDPDSDVLHYNLAVLYIKRNMIDKAKQALSSATKLNPDNQMAIDLLQKCN